MSYTANQDGVRNNASGQYIGQNREGTTNRLRRMRRLARMSPQTRRMRGELKRGQLPGSRNLLGKGKRKRKRKTYRKKSKKRRRTRKRKRVHRRRSRKRRR